MVTRWTLPLTGSHNSGIIDHTIQKILEIVTITQAGLVRERGGPSHAVGHGNEQTPHHENGRLACIVLYICATTCAGCQDKHASVDLQNFGC